MIHQTLGHITLYAIITGVVSVGTGLFGYWMQQKHQTRCLRTGLRAEIKSVDTDKLETTPATYLPLEVFSSNTNRLGLLSESEVEGVVTYYSTLIAAKKAWRDMEGHEREQFRQDIESHQTKALDSLGDPPENDSKY